MSRKSGGYVVIWNGVGLFQSNAKSIDRTGGPMRGVLFNAGCGAATLFSTLGRARTAVKRSIAYWSQYDRRREPNDYNIVRVRPLGKKR